GRCRPHAPVDPAGVRAVLEQVHPYATPPGGGELAGQHPPVARFPKVRRVEGGPTTRFELLQKRSVALSLYAEHVRGQAPTFAVSAPLRHRRLNIDIHGFWLRL